MPIIDIIDAGWGIKKGLTPKDQPKFGRGCLKGGTIVRRTIWLIKP